MRNLSWAEIRKGLLLGSSSLVLLSSAYAQDTGDTEETVTLVEENPTADNNDNQDEDVVVVTGSRIKKNTYTSIAPLQVITSEAARDVGIIDPAQILQKSEAAAGQQVDSTFAGLVLSNGPGSETVNLRGLGANRTLLLVNGRRLAPAGVEGAPQSPSINLIPSTLVERYELLLDGASSVYGSDAVAGVGNIILKQDFQGLQLEASGDYAVQGAGNDYTLSAAYGHNTDRGFIGFGAEYDYQDPVSLADRDFLSGCRTPYEVDENGEFRTQDISFRETYGQLGLEYPSEPCVLSGIGRRIRRVPGGLGFVYYTPGQTNTGIPNFSEDIQFGVPIDGDGDGVVDVVYGDYDTNGSFNNQSFINEQKRLSLMAYGEYTLEGEMNLTPYFEALHTTVDIFADSGASQLFTVVPASNPFNPCNPNQPTGVDCGLAADSLLTNPNYLESFRRFYFDLGNSGTCVNILGRDGCTPASFGLLNGPLGPQRAGGGVVVEGDRDTVDATLTQSRFVGGIRGDLPFLNYGSLSDWSFDASFVYNYSEGESARRGIRDDRLHFALGFDPNIRNATNQLVDLAGGPCVADPSSPVDPDIADGCVPVNLFAPSLYDTAIGTFATQAETDYLFDSRDFETIYEQTIVSAFASGSLMSLPAGDLSGVIGFEYRLDEIESIPDNVASEGLFFGFFSDQGAVGEKWTREAFFEVEAPILANHPLARELSGNVAARWTEDEFYGSEWTYSTRLAWRPIDPLLIKGTYGTSFRAPNLRENFLIGTTAFPTVFDPCVTPAAAVGLGGAYNPALDTRDQTTLDNCRADGIDPTNFSPIPGNVTSYSTESRQGGSLDLAEETSTSFTAGVAFEQPWFESFDATFNVTYYDIEVEDTVVSPSAQFIVNDCYTLQPNRQSAFCSRITRSPLTASANPGSFTLIDAGFINQDRETVSGLDINMDIDKEVTLFNTPVDLGVNLRANKLNERTTLFIGDDGTEAFDDDVGEFSFAEWTGRATFTADIADYRFTWQTRYVDEVEQDPLGIDAFSDVFAGGSETCLGPTRGDVQCRDVGFADEYMTHTASIRYTGDTWTVIAGVNNIFEEDPPLVDGSEVLQVSNAAIGAGYDYDGRQYFLNLRKRF
jgi:iron complex outermembrane receptor protein